MIFVKLLLLLFSFQSLTACGFGGGVIPADHYYRLSEVLTVEKKAKVFKSILIKPINVDGLYHERNILYIQKDMPLEIKRYNYHYWVEPPAKLVQKYMLSYLSQASISEKVSTYIDTLQVDAEITAQLLNFERIVDKGNIRVLVVMQLSAHLISNKKITYRTYRSEIPLNDTSMHTTVEGFGHALDDILSSFIIDFVDLKL